MFSLGPIRIILRAGTGVMLTLWMCVILARKKKPSNISPLHLLYFLQYLHTPHFCFVIWCRISSHTFGYNSLDVTKSELFPLPSAEQLCVCALSQTHKWCILAFCPPRRKRHRGRGWDQTHHIYSLGTTNGAGLGLFWGMKPPLARAVACPRVAGVTPPMKHTLVKYWGSNSALVQGMASGQHLQTLFCSISGFKYYIALPWQDIFSVLETGNKKNILSLGWRICPSLFQPNLTLVEFSASNF